MTKHYMICPMYSEDSYIDLAQKKTDKIALIDADRFKYIVAHNMYYSIFNDGETHSEKLLEDCISSCIDRYVFQHYEAKAYIFCFSNSSKSTFRYLLANEKEYKGQRKHRDDPYYYEQKFDDMAHVLTYISNTQLTFIHEALEADDFLSMMQCEHTFIHSIDKDLQQIPGTHYDENKHEFYEITVDQAFKTLMKQTIMGDTTDNVPGLKGCGPKFVESLDKFEGEQLVEAVLKVFMKKHGREKGLDMFVEMYNLVSMKNRRGEFNEEYYGGFYMVIDNLIKNDN
jgi:hypothetical protein